MSGYDKAKTVQRGPDEHYQHTLARIEQIQNQFTEAGSGKLKGKVAVITGVGSLKGIGYVYGLLSQTEG